MISMRCSRASRAGLPTLFLLVTALAGRAFAQGEPAAAFAPLTLDGETSLSVDPLPELDLGDARTVEFVIAALWDDEDEIESHPAVLGRRVPYAGNDATGFAAATQYSVHLTPDRQAIGVFDGMRFASVAFDFSDGEFHHVALVTADGQTDVFVDREFRGTLDAGYGSTESLPLHLGSSDGGSEFFVGVLASFRLWDGALTAEQVGQVADQIGAPEDFGDARLVAYSEFTGDGAEILVIPQPAAAAVPAPPPAFQARGLKEFKNRIKQKLQRTTRSQERVDRAAQRVGLDPGAAYPMRPAPPGPRLKANHVRLSGVRRALDDYAAGLDAGPPRYAPDGVGRVRLVPGEPGGGPPLRQAGLVPIPPVQPEPPPVADPQRPPRPAGPPPQLAAQQAARQQNAGAPQVQAAGPQAPPPFARARLQVRPNSPRVYDGPVVAPFDARRGGRDYPGELELVADHRGRPVARLKPGNGPGQLGDFIGGGANSRVYRSEIPGRVRKVVSLTDPDGTSDRKAQTITDQLAGRAMLSDVLAANPRSPFRVTRQDGTELVEKTVGNRTYKFAVTTEEDISSEVRDPRTGALLGRATNALDRANLRGGLSLQEELTISRVIRDLNRSGIVWTDHKLANLDVVPDATSDTGYRVVFFDFDAFRPVRGADRARRAETATRLQDEFDQMTSFDSLRKRLNADPGEFFDYTALGAPMGYLATPGANQNRPSYRDSSRFNHGQMDSAGAERLLAGKPPGTWVMRQGRNFEGRLSFVGPDGTVVHEDIEQPRPVPPGATGRESPLELALAHRNLSRARFLAPAATPPAAEGARANAANAQ